MNPYASSRLPLNVIATARIIVASMTVGILTLLVVAWLVPPQQAEAAADSNARPTLTYLALAFAAVNLIPVVVVPKFLAAARLRTPSHPAPPALRAGDVDDSGESATSALLNAWFTSVIVRVGLLEGSALFLAVAFMIERQIIAAAAALVLALVILVQMPSQDRVERWLARANQPQDLR